MTRTALFVFLGLLAVGAVGYTFTWAVPYSAFAAALAKVAMAVVLFWAVDRYLLHELDTAKELKAGNVAYAIFLLALALLLAPAIATGQPAKRSSATCSRSAVVDTAATYVGTQEVPNNRGPAVERFLASVGLGPGHPWCAAFVSYVLTQTQADVPTVRSAVATDFVTDRSLDATGVLRGTERVEPGALAVFRRGQTWKGHVGIVRRTWHGPCGRTIEGNTSPEEAGPQRDGDGVWRRHRCIHPGSYFRITAFTPTSS